MTSYLPTLFPIQNTIPINYDHKYLKVTELQSIRDAMEWATCLESVTSKEAGQNTITHLNPTKSLSNRTQCIFRKSHDSWLHLKSLRKRSGKILPVQAIKIYRGRGEYLHSFITSALTGGLWSTSCSVRFDPGKGTCTPVPEPMLASVLKYATHTLRIQISVAKNTLRHGVSKSPKTSSYKRPCAKLLL